MRRSLRGIVAAGAACVLFSTPAVAQDTGTWSTVGQTTTARTEIGGVEINGKVYVIGGGALGRQDSPMAQEFDPATGRWRDLAAMPKGVAHVGVAALNGKVYVAGFTRNVHLDPLDQFVVYDPASNTWQTLAPLSTRRGSVGLAAVDGKLHAIGGRTPDLKTVATHEVYDSATNKWTPAALLPTARDHLGTIVVDGKIHVFGGRLDDLVLDNVGLHDVYDPLTDKWQTVAPLPTKRSAGAAALYHGLILYHGGECKNPTTRATFDEFEAYDPKTDSWRTLTKGPTGLHAHVDVAVGNTVYFIGGNLGCGGDGPSSAIYTFRMP